MSQKRKFQAWQGFHFFEIKTDSEFSFLLYEIVHHVCKMIEEWWKRFRKYLDISPELRPESLALLGSRYIRNTEDTRLVLKFAKALPLPLRQLLMNTCHAAFFKKVFSALLSLSM